jgi:cytochrome c-type biogenesis protein CcmH/NrfF
MTCDVCDGTPGLYPIHNKFGTELYNIRCPECAGTGLSEADADEAYAARQMRMKYDAAMASKRAATAE